MDGAVFRDVERVQEEEDAEVKEEPYIPKFGLSQQELDSSIADCQRRTNQSMGHDSISQQTRTVSGDAGKIIEDDRGKDRRWADDVVAGLVNLD